MNTVSRWAVALAAGSALWSSGFTIALAQGAAIEEIIVTAQKREQNIQDVPISISAFQSDELEELRVLDATDVTKYVPNMELAQTPDNEIPIFVIRGVGLQDYNTNNTPTTAVVVDDVYQPYGIFAAYALFDTERVEILRGPQGGLYGRNSTAGAINVVSKRPSFEKFEANVAVDAGNYGVVNMRGAIGTPLGEKFAVRLGAQYDGSDGYYRNTYLNRDQGGRDKLQSRLTLSFEPTDAVSGDLRLTYGRDKSEVGIPELAGYLDPNTRWPGPIKLVDPNSPDMNVPFNPDPEDPFVGTPAYCEPVLRTGIPDATCVTANGFTPDGDPYSGADAETRRNDDEFKAGILNLRFDLGPVELVSNTSVSSLNFFHTNNIGSVGIADYQNPAEWEAYGALVGRANGGAVDPNYVTKYRSDISAWSQEFRLLSNSDGAFSWMLGAAYAKDDLDENRDCEFPANLYFDYAVFPGCGTMIYSQDTEVWSAYGQVAYSFTDALRLTVDGRYTGEKKDYNGGVWVNDGAWTCLLFGLDPTGQDPDLDCAALAGYDPVTNLFPLATGAKANYDHKDPSFKVTLDYAPVDDVLLYASVGQTFKSGGFFGGFFFSPDAIVAYKPEKNLAYEIGIRSLLADGRFRLNGAVFRYDYKDFQGNLQAQSRTAGGGAVFFGLTNLGDVETWGAEMDLRWLATDGLTLGLGLGYLDTKITKVSNAGFTDPDVIVGVTNILSQVVDIRGNELNHAPQLSGNVYARYDFPLTTSLGAAIQLDASWTDDYFLSVSNEPYSREQGVTLLNARAEILGGADRNWSLSVWGRNLTDETYRVSTNDDGVYSNYSNWSAPRTYGVTLAYRY